MIYKTLKLNEICDSFRNLSDKVTVDCYIQDISQNEELSLNRPCIIICPGGGYLELVNNREGEPIAMEFLAKGYNAFVLNYSVGGEVFPQQLLELSFLVSYLRKKCSKFRINPDKITVCGFSAGGHLACSLGVYWDKEISYKSLDIEYGENKPNSLILCYPVISIKKELIHQGTFDNLLGKNVNDEKVLEKVSLENHVDENMPRTFIFSTFADQFVPVGNSIVLAQKLHENKVLCEAHLYQDGFHGIGLSSKLTAHNPAYMLPHVSSWVKLALSWLGD